MKTLGAAGLLVLFLFSFVACRKDLSTEGNIPHGDTTLSTDPAGTSSGNDLVRIQGGLDPHLNNDTIFRITYTTSDKISVIIDSTNQDTLTAAYNPSGYLTSITSNNAYPVNASFYYDSIGELTRIYYKYKSTNLAEQYTFDYTNGAVVRKSYYSNLLSGGSVQLLRFYDYTLTGGNITGIKEYSATAILQSTTTYTFGIQANPFKALSQFNYALGLDDIINYETYFNKNIVTGFTVSGASAVMTNTFNSKQQITSILANDQVNQWVLNWLFFYK